VDTTATFSASGTYVLRLTASDSSLQAYDEVTITVHEAPSVNAGTDQTINLPSSATLDATVSDDGLPNPPAAVTTTWSKVSGPGTVTFGNANAVDTTASFSASGVYVLRLTGNDGSLQTTDDLTITVNTPGTTVYEADFDTDVSSDWSTSYTTVDATNSWMIVSTGWGRVGYAYLTGGEAIDEVDVRLTGHFTVANGNANGYAEIAGRTTGTGTDGIRLRLSGNGYVTLYDGDTVLDSATSTGLVPLYNPSLSFQLVAEGTTITGKIVQTAGDDGNGHSWNDVTVNLSGTASTYTSSGNVRFMGCSYTGQPKLLDIVVETLDVPANQAPVAVADSGFSTNEDTALVVTASSVLDNDTDGDSDPLTAIKVIDPSHGSVTLNSDGTFTYTPTANYNGSDSFTYKANDGTADSNTVSVSMTVNAVR
jgi:VCBS repeat-containing protein